MHRYAAIAGDGEDVQELFQVRAVVFVMAPGDRQGLQHAAALFLAASVKLRKRWRCRNGTEESEDLFRLAMRDSLSKRTRELLGAWARVRGDEATSRVSLQEKMSSRNEMPSDEKDVGDLRDSL